MARRDALYERRMNESWAKVVDRLSQPLTPEQIETESARQLELDRVALRVNYNLINSGGVLPPR